ncbi:MAG: prolyl-tRNA synthetase associated domain-containing protein [Patescibacteria group bacterium]|jgi:Ala-tRNA(Pro) deacylase|nr:prolyl-tRNA synthetase associated domain-containing protein [Patescibacteria group bacterium]
MDQVLKLLDQLNIPYQNYEHPAVFTVAQSTQLKTDIPGASTKNLFLRNQKKTSYYLVLILANKTADLKKLAADLGEDRLSFASSDDLKKFLGLVPGSVSVFGLINCQSKNLKVIVDNDFWQYDQIGFHPNDNRATTVIATNDLKKFLVSRPQEILFKNL